MSNSYIDQGTVIKNLSLLEKAAKLEKNRQCARDSRKRKKFYVELLEVKVSQLEDELAETKKLLGNSYEYIQNNTLQSSIVK